MIDGVLRILQKDLRSLGLGNIRLRRLKRNTKTLMSLEKLNMISPVIKRRLLKEEY